MSGESHPTKQPGSSIGDRLFAAAWLCVCLLIAYQMWKLDVPFAYEPVGPRAFPLLLSALMALCCLVLLVNPDRHHSFPDAATLVKGALLFAVLLAYGALFEVLGFPIGTALMVILVCRIFGGSLLAGVLAGLLVASLGYLLFDRFLEVTLPFGRIWN